MSQRYYANYPYRQQSRSRSRHAPPSIHRPMGRFALSFIAQPVASCPPLLLRRWSCAVKSFLRGNAVIAMRLTVPAILPPTKAARRLRHASYHVAAIEPDQWRGGSSHLSKYSFEIIIGHVRIVVMSGLEQQRPQMRYRALTRPWSCLPLLEMPAEAMLNALAHFLVLLRLDSLLLRFICRH